VESLFKRKALPVHSPEFTVELTTGSAIKATFEHGSVRLRLHIRGLRGAAIDTEATAMVKVEEMWGCYSCLPGGEVRYRCQLDGEPTMVAASCGASHTELMCDSTGEARVTRIAFDHAVINEVCTAWGPGGNSTFSLKGILNYISEHEGSPHSRRTVAPFGDNNSNDKHANRRVDWWALWEFLSEDWARTTLLGVCMVLAFAFFPSLALGLIYCCCTAAKAGGQELGKRLATHSGEKDNTDE
jgi:hypothetical protein